LGGGAREVAARERGGRGEKEKGEAKRENRQRKAKILVALGEI